MFVTRSRIIRDLTRLGLKSGDTVMLHASVKSIGWIVGGPAVVLQAILDHLGPEGTLLMLIGWEDDPYHLSEWPEKRRDMYLAECPAFDVETSRANRSWSILTEYLRTWEGAVRSNHPDKSFAAVGKLAGWLMSNHAWDHGYGEESSLAKLCQVAGSVLQIGSPMSSLTILHHAEYLAVVPNKREVVYAMPVLEDGKRVWRELSELDSSDGIVDWSGDDYFELIGQACLDQKVGATGKIGAAPSRLFPAVELVACGKAWMEEHFQ